MSKAESTVFEVAKNELIVPHTRKAGELIMWVCMDDRFLAKMGRLYRQYGGSIHGAATDLTVMTEYVRPGTFLDRENRQYTTDTSKTDVPGVAKDSHMILLENDIFVPLHEYCASVGLAPDVSTNIATLDEGDLWNRTIQFYPDAVESVFGQSREIHRAMTVQGMFRGHPQGITELPLVNMPHVATDVIANHKPGTAFNVYDAIGTPSNPSNPAYHVSFGDMPELFNPLFAVQEITVDEPTMKTVAAVRHAALSFQLPNQPLTVHHLA